MNFIDKNIEQFCVRHSTLLLGEVSQKIIERTQNSSDLPQMLSGEMENSLIGFLVLSLRPKVLVEIGTFTGYATMNLALNCDEEATIYTIDSDNSHLESNREDWKKAGVDHKIKFLYGDATQMMEKIPGAWDFVFIDADKENYPHYFEFAVSKLSANGMVVVDNALWSGNVLKGEQQVDLDNDTQGIYQTIQLATNNPELYVTLLPIRDGVLLVRRRANRAE